MLRQFRFVVVAALFLVQAGCGSADAGRIRDSSDSASMTTQPAVSATAAASIATTDSEAASNIQVQASHKGKPMDQAAIEQAVIADLAKYLKVDANQVKLTETLERIWPDRGLGCNQRRGAVQTVQTPGYLIRLQHNNKTFAYHTDLKGRFLRCMHIGKPRGPIMR